MDFAKFNQGSLVKYTGETLVKRYPENFKSAKHGEVVGRVADSMALVCEFGNDTFIIDPNNLIPYIPREKNESPEVLNKILRKWNVEEEQK